MYRKSIIMLIFTLLFSMSVMFVAVPEEANAASIEMWADLDPDANYNGNGNIDPTTVGTWPELAVNATAEVFFSFDASANFLNGEDLTLTLPAGWGVATTCASYGNTTDMDADGANDGDWTTISGTTATYTFDANTTVATTGVELCLTVTAPAAATNLAVYLAGTNTPSDFGAVLIYIGDANDVLVTANVTPVLRFEIRNSTDTGYTNTCPLGYMTTTALSTCDYRLKVYTNASNGYTVKITSDGDLSRAGAGLVPDADDIDPIAENGTVVAGTEGYGATFDAGACTYNAGAATETSPWDDDDTPIPTAVEDMYSCGGVNLPNANNDQTSTALVTHVAAIDAGTQSGNYSQTVTYYVIADF